MLKNESDEQLNLADVAKLKRHKSNPAYKRAYELVLEYRPKTRSAKALTTKVARLMKDEGFLQRSGKPFSKNSILGISGWYRDANNKPPFPPYQGKKKTKTRKKVVRKVSRTTELVSKAAETAKPLLSARTQNLDQFNQMTRNKINDLCQKLMNDSLLYEDKLTILGLLWVKR